MRLACAVAQSGVTVRKTADVIIASFCIDNGHSLLFSDRDFLPFARHLGLMRA
jgi:predicted nucleic acid-binding protein